MTTYITISEYLSKGGVLKNTDKIYLNDKESSFKGTFTGFFKNEKESDGVYILIGSDGWPYPASRVYVSIPVIPVFAIEGLIEKYEVMAKEEGIMNVDHEYFELLEDTASDLKNLIK